MDHFQINDRSKAEKLIEMCPLDEEDIYGQDGSSPIP